MGDETATPLAATITWLLRHGTGMCGQILFTWHQGSDLDYNCKKWRLFADVVNDMAMFIELLGPMLPMIFLQVNVNPVYTSFGMSEGKYKSSLAFTSSLRSRSFVSPGC